MDKKNIDELFREKFKTFREVPDEKVWSAIENSLDKKRKKRVIPFWFQWGGVAAVLAIALVAFYTLKDSGDESPTITNTEKTNSDDTQQDVLDTDSKQTQKDALKIPTATEDVVANGTKVSDLKNTDKYPASDADSVSGLEKPSGNNTRKNQKDAIQIPKADNNDVVHGEGDIQIKNTEKYAGPKGDKSPFSEKPSHTDVAGAESTLTKDDIKRDSSNTKNFRNSFPDKTQVATSGQDNESDDSRKDQIKEDNITIPANDKTDTLGEGERGTVSIVDAEPTQKKDTPKTDIKKNSQDGIVVNQGTSKIIIEKSDKVIAQNNHIEKDDIVKDTIVKDNEKSIFEALEAQNKEAKIVEESDSRWSAGPNVAPVYFDALGEGSPIDPGFLPNAKTGSTNLSYGLSIAYAVSKKLSVRSGIHKAEYGYNTNNVGFSPTLAASTSGRLLNIDYVGGSENLAVNNSDSNQGSPENFAPEFSNLNASRDGRVAQQFGYIEVPLELDYALIDRRFGVNLIGGISSLFLIDNSVTLSSGELTTEIGEARNLNNLNFSTNVGFGVNYKFTPKVQLNIEPVFKYQLNTFSNVSGDFRPYSIGVYSGLNFKF